MSADQVNPASHGVADVVLICGVVGFPVGLATSQAIGNTARAISEGGLPTTVLHCGPHPYLDHVEGAGVFKGVAYKYLGPARKRPANRWLRIIANLLAYVALAWELLLRRLRAGTRPVVAISYLHGGGAYCIVAALCLLLGVKLISFVTEWPPAFPETKPLKRWVYLKRMFVWSSGATVISSTLLEVIQSDEVRRRRALKLYLLPVMLDPDEMSAPVAPRVDRDPTIVWCGDVDGYLKDVLFLVEVVKRLWDAGERCNAEFFGPVTKRALLEVEEAARRAGLGADRIVVHGYVSRAKLLEGIQTATMLFMPLWNDVRSAARLPNKMGEYLMSAHPVVTCKVGDAQRYLVDGESVAFYEVGDARDCARAIAELLRNPRRAMEIGQAGRRAALASFSYKAHTPGLVQLINDVAGVRQVERR